MTDEIEEGELYSDEDELNNNSTKTKSIKDKTFGLKNQLNNEEKQELNKLINNTFGADEEDEDFVAQIDNPYDEEDVMMIELKMKALQSLLEKNSAEMDKNNESTTPKKKPKKKLNTHKNSMKKAQKSASITDADEETCNENETERGEFENGFKQMNQKRKGFKNRKLQKKFKSTNENGSFEADNKDYYLNLGIKSLNKLNMVSRMSVSMRKDNYEIQDMEVEANNHQQGPMYPNSTNRIPSLLHETFYPSPNSQFYPMNTSPFDSSRQQQHQQQQSNNFINFNGTGSWSNSMTPLQNNGLLQVMNQITQTMLSNPSIMAQMQMPLLNSMNPQIPPLLPPPININNNQPNLNFQQNQNKNKNSMNNNIRNMIKKKNQKKNQQQVGKNNSAGLNNKPSNAQNANFSNKNLKQVQKKNEEVYVSTSTVKFTLSSPSSSSSNSSLVSPLNNLNTKPSISPVLSVAAVLDVDERFLDKTTSSLDIDYRQINLADKKSESKNEADASPKSDKEDEEMLELRKGILDTLNKKREQKRIEQELKEKEEKVAEEKQLDEDISLLRLKLFEHEQELMSTPAVKNHLKSDDVLSTSSLTKKNSTIITPNPNKLTPIIIRLNCKDDSSESEHSDNENRNTSPQIKELKTNINKFLLEAKQLALSSNSEPVVEPKPDPKPVADKTKQLEREMAKKDIIKTLRDKINLKSKTIIELNKKSLDLKQLSDKKEKDIELTKQKILMLKEQLQAAEKILSVNEQSCDNLKSQKRMTDSRLIKLQNMKKIQQQLLQKILSNSTTTGASTAASTGSPTVAVESNSPPSPISQTDSQPPLPSQLPPLPKSPPPTPPPLPPLPPQPTQPSEPQQELVKISDFSLKKLPVQLTLGAVVAATNNSSVTSLQKQTNNLNKENSTNNITRPNLFTSKSTNTKLEQLALNKFDSSSIQSKMEMSVNSSISQNSSTALSSNVSMNEVVVNAKVVSVGSTKAVNNKHKLNNIHKVNNLVKSTPTNNTNSAVDSENKKLELMNRQKLSDCVDGLLVDYPYVHMESFDLWSNEGVILEKSPSILSSYDMLNSSEPVISINTVLTSRNYPGLEQSNEVLGNDFESYISAQTNEIHLIEDVSNYESPLKMFRGYRFSTNFSEFNQFEDAYSKFYCNAIDFRKPFCPFDLHGSCKDSNCIYQHSNVMTMDNFQRTEHFLSYCPQVLELSGPNPTQKEVTKKLKLYAKDFMNNNLNRMSIRDYFKYLYDHIISHLNIDPPCSIILSRHPTLCLNNNKSIGVYDNQELTLTRHQSNKILTANLTADQYEDQILTLLDTILCVNMTRSLDIKLKNLLINSRLDIDLIKNNQNNTFDNEFEIIIGWIYLARHVYTQSSLQIEKLLNILSHSLESNSKCEILWLIYLKCYLSKRNAHADYHEICMLCMDNVITYDLVWFILNTCNQQFIDIVIEKYEKYLLNVSLADLNGEFEQETSDQSTISCVSFYLIELIFFNVYLKLNINDNEESRSIGKQLFYKYLHSNETVSRIEPNDLCMLWLCYIHLEAFNCLPSWLRVSELIASKIIQFIDPSPVMPHQQTRLFWQLNSKKGVRRSFNSSFLRVIHHIYSIREECLNERKFDMFLLQWSKLQPQTVDKIKSLFGEALKAINTRCSTDYPKESARLISLPLFISLINLEVSNKKYDTANRMCDRLLQSADAKMLKELWLSLIYIQRCSQTGETGLQAIETTIKKSLEVFPIDGRVQLTAAKFYNTISQSEKSIQILEKFIRDFYKGLDSEDQSNDDTEFLFRNLLGLSLTGQVKIEFSKQEGFKKYDLQDMDILLSISICFCYYQQLKAVSHQIISQTFEEIISKFDLINHKSIIWARYFKYLSTVYHIKDTKDTENPILSLIKKCIDNLNELSKSNLNYLASQMIIPFNYLPINNLCIESNNFQTCLVSRNDSDFNNQYNSQTNYYYYHNSIVDTLIKLFSKTVNEKFALAKHLLNLMPNNTDLIKIVVYYSNKLSNNSSGSSLTNISNTSVSTNNQQKTLQMFYDHLIINSIDSEQLWILCIKLCLDLNDLQQAILIYQKAEQICTKQRKSTLELKKLSKYLFPESTSVVS